MALPNVTVFDDADAVAAAMAERIVALSHAGGRATIALSGGSTPQRLYRLLATPAMAARVDWPRLHLFWGDERFVAPDSADSGTLMVEEALVRHVPIPAENVHRVATGLGSPEAAAADYAARLRAHYGADALDPGRPLFDLVLLGMGDDGHTASLFPGKLAVEERAAWVTGVPEAGMAPWVPRVTLTFPALASSREVAFLVTGASKAAMLRRIAAGEDFPAGRVTSQGRVGWWLDRAAAGA